MKKIILTFFVLLLLSFKTTYAEECLIKSKMGDNLSEYIKNTDKILSKINEEVGSPPESADKNAVVEKVENSFDEIISRVVGAYNSSFNFTNYFAKIDIETEYPKNIEIPKEIKRDLKRLKKTGKKIITSVEKVMKSKNSGKVIKGFCKDFDDIVCKIENEVEAKNLIKAVLINYKNVEGNVVNTILGKKSKLKNVQFVNENFNLDLEKYYAPESFTKCNAEEGGFLHTIEEKTEEIGNANKYMNRGMQDWKDAWNLLIGKDGSKALERETEKRVLREELSRQGVSGDNQTNMLKNLEKYNKDGFSENNNFISNTFNSTKVKVDNNLSDFRKEVLGDFTDFLGKSSKDNTEVNEDKNISIDTIKTAKTNSENSKDIKERIENIYNGLIPYTAISENNTDKLRERIINIHIELEDSIDILKESCKKSVKICNQQDYGNGNCGKCQ